MRLAEIERRGVTAEQDRQFIVENLNDLLTGGNAAEHAFAKRLLFDLGNEFFRDRKINIGLEQREPDLSQRRVDVLFADFSVAAKILEDLLQLIAKLRKHSPPIGRPQRRVLSLRRRARS